MADRLRSNVDRRAEELAAERGRERPVREIAPERESGDQRRRPREQEKHRTQARKKDHGLES